MPLQGSIEVKNRARYIKKGRGVLCQRNAVKYAWIKKNQTEFKVADMCRVLEVYRSAYYHWLMAETPMRTKTDNKITEMRI